MTLIHHGRTGIGTLTVNGVVPDGRENSRVQLVTCHD
jgi:hypothetical protein